MRRLGYIRINTTKESANAQRDVFIGTNCDEIYTENITSWEDNNRPELESLLSEIEEGDTVVVASYDNLSIDVLDLKSIMEELKKKKVKLESANKYEDKFLPYTGTGDFFITLMKSMYDFQRDKNEELTEEERRIQQAQRL